jgi:large subunit ribosomal protein L37Ae
MAKITAKGRKTRSAGRFGVRYGTKARKLVADSEEKMRANYTCAKCGEPKITRISTGIWQCYKCNHTFAGGTYVPQTPAHITVLRAVQAVKAEISKKAAQAIPAN